MAWGSTVNPSQRHIETRLPLGGTTTPLTFIVTSGGSVSVPGKLVLIARTLGAGSSIARSRAIAHTALVSSPAAVIRQKLIQRAAILVSAFTPPQSYSSLVLGLGPALYWRLGESSGSGTVADSSGNARVGTPNAGVTLGASGLIAGDSDTSGDFNGTNGRVISAPIPAFAGDGTTNGLRGGYSLSAVIRSDVLSAVGQVAINIFGLNGFLIINNGTAGIVQTGHRDDGGGFPFIQATGIAASTTYHIVGTYDGVNERIYVNGQLVAGPTALAPPAKSVIFTGSVEVGANNNTNLWFDGRIDEVAIFTRALTAAEVLDLYLAGVSTGRFGYTKQAQLPRTVVSSGSVAWGSSRSIVRMATSAASIARARAVTLARAIASSGAVSRTRSLVFSRQVSSFGSSTARRASTLPRVTASAGSVATTHVRAMTRSVSSAVAVTRSRSVMFARRVASLGAVAVDVLFRGVTIDLRPTFLKLQRVVTDLTVGEEARDLALAAIVTSLRTRARRTKNTIHQLVDHLSIR